MSDKHVYRFSEGNKTMRELLGGKGANLAEMTSIGLPVPPGFTITTEVCNYYWAHSDYPAGVGTRPGAQSHRTYNTLARCCGRFTARHEAHRDVPHG